MDRRTGSRRSTPLHVRLPLALAVLAARRAAHPTFPLDTIVDGLRESPRLLDSSDGGDTGTDVQSVFSWSYRNLTPRRRA
ncbi:hypothetical protein [Micromonospora wenchangensis]|uniref:hypothetical protein n=1 Tax=Micromonospora wenchangensis TaxID=1185415 RepID=UPI0037FA906C